ncbi:hypothetical protein [Xanthomonas arboricola]|uniref:hypothetical protein n=1 Tax=Xanthomonas arboricola TaxID=56448 RepID=UPI001E456927|nr:hypothetical protein [Xanthomonas arboricola]
MAAVVGFNPIATAKRILFKTLPDGDWKKFTGQSNANPGAGGGARDLRYNGISSFSVIAATLFPSTKQELRKRGGIQQLLTIYEGELRYGVAPNQKDSAVFESPTDSRKGEWRLPQVTGMTLTNYAAPVAGSNDEDILVLAQQANGEVWAIFSTVSTVTGGLFPPFIQAVVTGPNRRKDWAAVGYWDTIGNILLQNT